MKVEVKCPQCEKALSIEVEHASWMIRCRHCSYRFLPVVDAGVPCPECGTVLILGSGDTKHVTCHECGFDFESAKKQRRNRRICVWAGIAAAVLLLIILLSMLPGGSGLSAGERKAVAILRSLCSAKELYYCRFETYGTLDDLYTCQMIDAKFASMIECGSPRDGYIIELYRDGTENWYATAVPVEPGVTGTRSFYVDKFSTVRSERCESASDPPAGPESKPVKQ